MCGTSLFGPKIGFLRDLESPSRVGARSIWIAVALKERKSYFKKFPKLFFSMTIFFYPPLKFDFFRFFGSNQFENLVIPWTSKKKCNRKIDVTFSSVIR